MKKIVTIVLAIIAFFALGVIANAEEITTVEVIADEAIETVADEATTETTKEDASEPEVTDENGETVAPEETAEAADEAEENPCTGKTLTVEVKGWKVFYSEDLANRVVIRYTDAAQHPISDATGVDGAKALIRINSFQPITFIGKGCTKELSAENGKISLVVALPVFEVEQEIIPATEDEIEPAQEPEPVVIPVDVVPNDEPVIPDTEPIVPDDEPADDVVIIVPENKPDEPVIISTPDTPTPVKSERTSITVDLGQVVPGEITYHQNQIVAEPVQTELVYSDEMLVPDTGSTSVGLIAFSSLSVATTVAAFLLKKKKEEDEEEDN